MSSGLRILVVGNSFSACVEDWTASFAYSIMSQLQRHNHTITIVAPERIDGYPDRGELDIIRLPAKSCLGKDGGLAMPFRSVRSIPAMFTLHNAAQKVLEDLCEQRVFDIGISLWAVPSGWWLYYISKQYNFPYITWALGSDIWGAGRKPFIKNIVKNVLAESAHQYADGMQLCDEVAALSGKPCEFLPTSRQLPVVQPVVDDNLVGKKLFVFIGRLERVKGVDVLIRAFKKATIDNGVLYIFGIGSQEKKYEDMVRHLGLEGRVFIKGQISAQDAANYLAYAQCCVIPSRMESIPMVLSDALQCGCPLVVTRVGDMGELVEKNNLGLAVNPDNADELAGALEQMSWFSRASFAEAIGRTRDMFTIETTADILEKKAYEIVAARKEQ